MIIYIQRVFIIIIIIKKNKIDMNEHLNSVIIHFYVVRIR